MKIIDLLNKKANGEDVPKKFEYDDNIFIYDNEENDYIYEDGNISFFNDYCSPIYNLEDCLATFNKEVEIIEDKTPQETIKQISKMIASGKIPKDIYDEYLSNCPIGFMNENELVDFLLEREAIDENSLENMIDESLFEDKDIEKITIAYKINELIDEVNRLKNKE